MAIPRTKRIQLYFLAVFISATFNSHADDAKQIFNTNCASCHGESMQGSGLGPALNVDSYKYGGRREDFVRIINNGMQAEGMPSFADTLSSEQITALSEFLPGRLVKKTEGSNQASADQTEPKFAPIPGTVSTLDYHLQIDVIADKLEIPWGIAFPDKQHILFTERSGRLRLIKNGELVQQPVKNTPDVLVSTHKWNQGGLLDVALHPEYANNGWVYLSFSHALDEHKRNTDNTEEALGMLRIVRGKIKNHRWTQNEMIFQAPIADYNRNFYHYGGRMHFDANGFLYFSIGDRGAQEQARDLSKAMGKIHRVHANGEIPVDNPFRNTPNALASIFSYGHRNPQGLSLSPSGDIWSTEQGPRGGDELNIINIGGDYGWPIVTHGINYDGTLLTPNTRLAGIEQPVLYWRPSTAVSGSHFYHGKEFPLWTNKLLVTSLKNRDLRLLTIDKQRVQHSEILIKFEGRPYQPAVGPDGAIYIAIDSPSQILRISAIEQRKI